MDDLSAIKNQVEFIFLKRLAKGLKDTSMKSSDVKKYAQEFMQLLPFSSFDDLNKKIETFTQKYGQFSNVYEYIHAYYIDKQTASVLKKMSGHIQNNDIDQALQVAKTIQ